MNGGEGFFRRYQLLIRLGLVVVAIAALIVGVFVYESTRPIDLKTTNLKDASSSVRNRAAAQVSTPINGLPAFLSDAAQADVRNQLGFILRQKYGKDAVPLSGTVRQELGYDAANNYRFLIDVPAKNETYLTTVNITNDISSLDCAPQDQQMNPETSACVSLPGEDDNVFPNG